MASTVPRRRSTIGWPGVAGVAISIALLWWALRDVHPAELFQYLGNARPIPLFLMAVFATLTFVVRTLRWRYILRLDGERLPYTPLWHATAIGFMANNLLPARTGEIARALAASKMTSVRFSTAAATIVVARLMDGLTITALLVLAAAGGGFRSDTTVGPFTLGQLIGGTGAVFVSVLGVAIAAVHWPAPARKVVVTLSGWLLPQRWAGVPVAILDGLLEGLEVLRDWRRFAAVTVLSLGVWGVNGVSFWLGLVAFNIAVPWTAAFVLQSLVGYGVAIPSSPGFFGPFEAVTRATLSLYGVAGSLAVSFAVGYHLLTFLPITVLGLFSLTRAHLHLGEIRHARREVPGAVEKRSES